MTDRSELLRRPVKTLDEANAWIADLAALDLMFHFEDDPADMLDNSMKYTFTPDEVPHIRDRIAELYAIDWPKEIECPIGHALDIIERGWRTR